MGKLPKIVGRGMPHPTLSVALSCGKVIVEILENVLILHLSLKKKKECLRGEVFEDCFKLVFLLGKHLIAISF